MGPTHAHYSGQAFQTFARELGFQHVTNSPHYLRGNSFGESQVKSVKVTLLKAKTTQGNSFMALLCLKTAPINHKLSSPAELLLGRAIQDNLPGKIPRDALNEAVALRHGERQELQRYFLPHIIWLLLKLPQTTGTVYITKVGILL